jgi:hypothetical protein
MRSDVKHAARFAKAAEVLQNGGRGRGFGGALNHGKKSKQAHG